MSNDNHMTYKEREKIRRNYRANVYDTLKRAQATSPFIKKQLDGISRGSFIDYDVYSRKKMAIREILETYSRMEELLNDSDISKLVYLDKIKKGINEYGTIGFWYQFVSDELYYYRENIRINGKSVDFKQYVRDIYGDAIKEAKEIEKKEKQKSGEINNEEQNQSDKKQIKEVDSKFKRGLFGPKKNKAEVDIYNSLMRWKDSSSYLRRELDMSLEDFLNPNNEIDANIKQGLINIYNYVIEFSSDSIIRNNAFGDVKDINNMGNWFDYISLKLKTYEIAHIDSEKVSFEKFLKCPEELRDTLIKQSMLDYAERERKKSEQELLKTIKTVESVISSVDNSPFQDRANEVASNQAKVINRQLVSDRFNKDYHNQFDLLSNYMTFGVEHKIQKNEIYDTVIANASKENIDFQPRDLLLPYYIEREALGINDDRGKKYMSEVMNRCGNDRARYNNLLATSLDAVLDIERQKGINEGLSNGRFGNCTVILDKSRSLK